MKPVRNLVLVLGALLLLAPSFSMGDPISKVGTTGAQFLKLGMGAKYAALGEAAVATVDDGYAMYWNPGALGRLQKSYLEFTNIQWLDGVSLNYFSFARPTYLGTFGVSVTAMMSGDIEVTTTERPDGTGEFYSANSYALSVGYARQMTDFFSVGLAAKYVSEKISEEQASGIAFDFGTILYTGFRDLRIGMNIANLGPSLRFDGPELNFNYDPDPSNAAYDQAKGVYAVEDYNLPLMFRIGVAYDIHYGENARLTLAAETRDPSDNEQQASIGSELAFNEHFFARAGWKFNYAEEGLTLGAGINLAVWENTDFAFNYAWADFGRLESAHRFSLGFRF